MIWQHINAHTHKHIQINQKIIYIFVYIHKCTCTTSYLLVGPMCLWCLVVMIDVLKLDILIMCVELSMDPHFFSVSPHQALWAWTCRYFFCSKVMLSMRFDFKGKGVAIMLVGFFLILIFKWFLDFATYMELGDSFFLYLTIHGATDMNIIYKRTCQVSFDYLLLKIIFIILLNLCDKLQH
jgi:hypothetical protein